MEKKEKQSRRGVVGPWTVDRVPHYSFDCFKPSFDNSKGYL